MKTIKEFIQSNKLILNIVKREYKDNPYSTHGLKWTVPLFNEEKKEALPINPTFGPLNKEEWLQFHKKHLTHHFTQLGLIEE
jgi:hypothetical protein